MDVNYLIDIELLILNEVNDKNESINLSLNIIIARDGLYRAMIISKDFYIFSTVLMPNMSKPVFRVLAVSAANFKRLCFSLLLSAAKIGQFS